MSTKFPSKEEVRRNSKWFVVDAAGQSVGRVASQVAYVLQGKHKPNFSRHVDTGDHVIILNAEKVVFTGRKLEQKVYYDYSGYIGGLQSRPASVMMQTNPAFILERAVQGMLPKGPLGRRMLKKLKVYAGSSHSHSSQQPVPFTLPTVAAN